MMGQMVNQTSSRKKTKCCRLPVRNLKLRYLFWFVQGSLLLLMTMITFWPNAVYAFPFLVALLCILNGYVSSQLVRNTPTRPELDFFIPNASYVDEHERSYVAVCTLIQDQPYDIREWVKYHQYLGIKKFYIFDDMSDPPLIDEIKDLVQEGLVAYFYMGKAWMGNDHEIHYGSNNKQKWSFNSCYRWFRKRHRFIGFIDIDEFIIMPDERTGELKTDFVSFLREYENESQVRLFWRVFGSSGNLKRQPSTLQSYTKCMPARYDPEVDDKHVSMVMWQYKSFMNTVYQVVDCDVHECRGQKLGVNTLHVPMRGGRQSRLNYWTLEKAYLAHYMIKSRQEQEEKTLRGFTTRPNTTRPASFYEMVDRETKDDCNFLVDLARKCCQ
eukprot:TRINITY_DN10255_c0_g2_i1.p1 TRINITY_DN10255_c0_g2~~TRINITY_DN10255_c0_g2_i1.p1  ORF type:complete len:384 (-),score=0.65 TRINITY_DN10255_c0_g2_i1:2316-3467(-)